VAVIGPVTLSGDYDGQDFAVYVYKPDGTLDTNFNPTDGHRTFASAEGGGDVQIDPDDVSGGTVIVGMATDSSSNIYIMFVNGVLSANGGFNIIEVAADGQGTINGSGTEVYGGSASMFGYSPYGLSNNCSYLDPNTDNGKPYNSDAGCAGGKGYSIAPTAFAVDGSGNMFVAGATWGFDQYGDFESDNGVWKLDHNGSATPDAIYWGGPGTVSFISVVSDSHVIVGGNNWDGYHNHAEVDDLDMTSGSQNWGWSTGANAELDGLGAYGTTIMMLKSGSIFLLTSSGTSLSSAISSGWSFMSVDPTDGNTAVGTASQLELFNYGSGTLTAAGEGVVSDPTGGIYANSIAIDWGSGGDDIMFQAGGFSGDQMLEAGVFSSDNILEYTP